MSGVAVMSRAEVADSLAELEIFDSKYGLSPAGIEKKDALHKQLTRIENDDTAQAKMALDDLSVVTSNYLELRDAYISSFKRFADIASAVGAARRDYERAWSTAHKFNGDAVPTRIAPAVLDRHPALLAVAERV